MPEEYEGSPRRCDRFNRNGQSCQNLTRFKDGWCRELDCDGFRRRAVAKQAPDEGTYTHTTERTAVDGLPYLICDRSVVRVSQRAIDSYLFHHGGDRMGAIKDLLEIAEDFSTIAKVYSLNDGQAFHLLTKGYSIVLANEGKLIGSYSTVHKERTWPQVKEGVASRVAAPKKVQVAPKNWMVALADAPTQTAVPAELRITATALSTFKALQPALSSANLEEVDGQLQAFLEHCGETQVSRRTDDNFEFTHSGVRGIVDPQLTVLIRFMIPRDDK